MAFCSQQPEKLQVESQRAQTKELPHFQFVCLCALSGSPDNSSAWDARFLPGRVR